MQDQIKHMIRGAEGGNSIQFHGTAVRIQEEPVQIPEETVEETPSATPSRAKGIMSTLDYAEEAPKKKGRKAETAAPAAPVKLPIPADIEADFQKTRERCTLMTEQLLEQDPPGTKLLGFLLKFLAPLL